MSEFRKISPVGRVTGVNQSFLVTRAGLQVLKGQLINVPDHDFEESDVQSLLNTPVIDNIVFQSGVYTDLEGNEIEYDELRIDAVIIEVAQTKNIIKTAVQGRNGTIKEYIADGDYIINIRGIIQSLEKDQQRIYPIDLMNDLMSLCKAQRSLVVTSTFLNEVFGIDNIVIESYRVPQVEGLRNQQPFTISASSDIDVELEELEI